MDMSNTLVTDEWADWPKASPTSTLGINIRFYGVIGDTGETLRLDIGAETEEAFEALYDALDLVRKLPNNPRQEFERHSRSIFQTRMENLLPYAVIVSQYAILTTDIREVQRSLLTEQRTLKRLLALLPYRLLPQLLPKDMTRSDHLRYRASQVLTRLRLLLPFG